MIISYIVIDIHAYLSLANTLRTHTRTLLHASEDYCAHTRGRCAFCTHKHTHTHLNERRASIVVNNVVWHTLLLLLLCNAPRNIARERAVAEYADPMRSRSDRRSTFWHSAHCVGITPGQPPDDEVVDRSLRRKSRGRVAQIARKSAAELQRASTAAAMFSPKLCGNQRAHYFQYLWSINCGVEAKQSRSK